MLLYLMLCISIRLTQVDTFLLRESYDIQLEDGAQYKIDESINEDDYEMIDRNVMAQFEIHDKINILDALKKIASNEYDKALRKRRSHKEFFRGTETEIAAAHDVDNDVITTVISPLTKHPISKRDLEINQNGDDDSYDYETLAVEYYNEAVAEGKSNKTYHAVISGESETGIVHSLKKLVSFDTNTRNCTEEEIKNIGIKALNCILKDYQNDKTDPKVLVKRLLRITTIWICVYLAVAIPMWCTKGWCCCCLYCKFFKPRQTIQEAKKYLVANPPGVVKTGRGKVAQYEPTESELKSYEEFEHFIKIV